MLNMNFGGLAVNSNLIPIPQAINRALEAEFDNKVSRELYQKKKVIWMRFTIERNHPQDTEKHFVSNFKAEAAEMPLSNNTYAAPSSGKINFEKGGADLPYPTIPSSALTLNSIIAAGDSSRDSVRAVARSTQLEERLVGDLVVSGIKLTSVDDIRTFINSKLSDYGKQRVSNYLANFERVKNSIVL